MSNHDRYDPNFRFAESREIISALDSSYCVSVIGAPSVGKTNLLRFIDQGEDSPLGKNSPWIFHTKPEQVKARGPWVAIRVDPNLLMPPLSNNVAGQSWPGFVLFIRRMLDTPGVFPILSAPPLPSPDDPAPAPPAPELLRAIGEVAARRERYEKAYEGAISSDDHLVAHLVQCHFEDMIREVLEGHEALGNPIRIAFLIDEFEYLLAAMPDHFFAVLRGLRDRFKYKIAYVTFTRNRLESLAGERLPVIEGFIELFTDKVVFLGPYDIGDSWRMIERLEKRTETSPNDYTLQLIIDCSGGFGGLLRTAFKHRYELDAIPQIDLEQATRVLFNKQNVRAECRTLLRGLLDFEIKALYMIAAHNLRNSDPSNTDLDPDLLDDLCNKKLLTKTLWDKAEVPEQSARYRYEVSPILLRMYINANPTDMPSGRRPAQPATLAPPRPLTLPP